MNIIVTGGAGFIGSNFVFHMLNKYPDYRIICLDCLTYAGNLSTLAPVMDNPNFRFVKEDITNREAVYKLFEEEKPDIVVNFAAESHVDRSIEDPEVFLRTNIMGTAVLMDACRKYGIKRYHQVSTDEVYGDLPLDRPDLFFTEETPIHTSSPYSSSKASADLLVLAYHRTYGLPVTISRCSNNYGPYHFPEKLIPLMIANALNDKPLPVLYNSWEATEFNIDVSQQTALAELAADIGVELFVMDDGWFGNRFPRNDARAGLGDWQENRAKLPHGIDGLAEKAEELGIRFGIWVEPEMVNPQSELFLSHPDWVIGLPGRENRLERSQYLLDLSNPEVRGYILGVMRELLGKHPGIAYVKWDCNRKISDPGSAWLDARHQGNLAIDYVRGYESVLDALAEEFPQVVFQACSSGGGRADYGTMRRHHEFWTSDNTDACERVFMQWSIGHLFPAISMGAHVTASPNHQTGRAVPLKFRFDAAMAARLGFELQPCDMTEEDAAFSRRALAEYKRIRPVVQFGDLYRLSSPYESRMASLMYVREDRAVVFAWLMDKWLADAPPPLRLKGLKPGTRYLLRELNMDGNGSLTHVHEQVLGGDFLMNAGIRINWKKTFQSVCLECIEGIIYLNE